MITTDLTETACFGWGSLVWDPGKLLVSPEWSKDGLFRLMYVILPDVHQTREVVARAGFGPVLAFRSRCA
jgi:hypothetical protein